MSDQQMMSRIQEAFIDSKVLMHFHRQEQMGKLWLILKSALKIQKVDKYKPVS